MDQANPVTPVKKSVVHEAASHKKQKNMFATQKDELIKSQERFQRMIAEIEDYAIILMDLDGTVENWNKGAERIKGYKAEEIVGKNFRIFYTREDQKNLLPEKLIREATEKGKAQHEGWRVRKDGSTFWGSVTITALHDSDNEVIGFTKITRDLTDKKRAEDDIVTLAQELEEKNRALESKNQELVSFAYVSSHDLQEPLRKIQTFASRILESEEAMLSPRGKDYFQRMQNAAARMQTLIEDLLAYSRLNSNTTQMELTDLNSVLEDVKAELGETIEAKHAQIDAAQLPVIRAVAFQMRQLFTNILGNALKFSKTDVTPVIAITYNTATGIDVPETSIHPKKRFHHIAITDNGIGFDPQHRTRIFEVFQRLQGRSEYSGTGIGLAICKKIMENHNGFITADALPDQGATFHVYFPV